MDREVLFNAFYLEAWLLWGGLLIFASRASSENKYKRPALIIGLFIGLFVAVIAFYRRVNP